MIFAGQRWHQKSTGRIVVVLEAPHKDIWIAWRYEDEGDDAWRKSLNRAFGEWALFTKLPAIDTGGVRQIREARTFGKAR